MIKFLNNKWQVYKHDPKSLLLFFSVCLAACITMFALFFIIAYILIKGIPNLTPELFDIKYTSKNVSLLPALINTLFITVLSLFFAVPVGISAAIYLAEYAQRGNKLVHIISVIWYSIYYLWIVWLTIFCQISWFWTIVTVWSLYFKYYDFAAYYTDNTRSP